MHNDYFFDFTVKCMLHIDDIRKMQVHFTYDENGKPFNWPCNGCEFENGAKECDLCKVTINTIFFNNPDFRPTHPLNLFNYL